MPIEDNNNNPLLNIKAPESQSITPSSTEDLTPSTAAPEQPAQPKTLFDIKSPDLKKKEPTMLQEAPKPLSTSQLEGSTSELEGSTLASSPRTAQADDFPTITGEELQAYDDGNLPQVRKRIRQREAIENVLRNNIAANPDLINTPGASEELQKRVLDMTGDDVLAEQITKSLRNISRERRVLDSRASNAANQARKQANE